MDESLSESLDTRKRIIGIIQTKPGIHFRKLHRESKLAMGEVEYHLNVLEKMELVVKDTSTPHTRYFPSNELSDEEKKIMGLLRQEKLREILLLIISEEEIGHGDIVKEFHFKKSTASFYLDKLISYRIIEKKKKGRNVSYKVTDPREIVRLLLLYKEGFGDWIAKRVEDLWADL